MAVSAPINQEALSSISLEQLLADQPRLSDRGSLPITEYRSRLEARSAL